MFNGQFKSETICQVCKKSSITYDPFMFLCLPLPKKRKILKFRIFGENMCRFIEFEYSKNSTIKDVKDNAMKLISTDKIKKDLEVVLIDKLYNIEEIISMDTKNKSYKGNLELIKILNDKDIVFYEKVYMKDNTYSPIFIYPIEPQKPFIQTYYIQKTNLSFFSYPLYFQAPNDMTIQEFITEIDGRIKALKYFNQIENANFFLEKKVMNLCIIHGKNTKKGGFLSFFSTSCKFCNKSYEDSFYCPFLDKFNLFQKIGDCFKNFKEPIILGVESSNYNKNEEIPYLIKYKGNVDEYVNGTIKLKDAIDLFEKSNNLQDDDTWYCSVCKLHQSSTQKLQIYKPPNYLIIQLKRFNIKKNADNEKILLGEKNNIFVNYPLDDFDLREYIVGPEKDDAIYELYGVIQHSGSLGFGHYTAICKNSNMWVEYNDSQLYKVKDPRSSTAYILFYKKKNLNLIQNERKSNK